LSAKIYCKFTVEYAVKISDQSTWLSYRQKADCLTNSACLGTVQLKDEEIARYLE